MITCDNGIEDDMKEYLSLVSNNSFSIECDESLDWTLLRTGIHSICL